MEPDERSKCRVSGSPCSMSGDLSMPLTIPAPMQEGRSEKAIWTAASSNVHGTDGDSMCKPAQGLKILTSPSPVVLYESKGTRFRWRCRNTLFNRQVRSVCLVYLVYLVYLVNQTDQIDRIDQMNKAE